MKKIMTYQTYKKKFNPKIYGVRDSTKGWVLETVEPTMRKAGFKCESIIYDAGSDINSLSINTNGLTPLELLHKGFNTENHELIVYHVYRHFAGFSKCLNIFYK